MSLKWTGQTGILVNFYQDISESKEDYKHRDEFIAFKWAEELPPVNLWMLLELTMLGSLWNTVLCH